MPDPAAEIVPDSKDWTWVLARRCAECGTDAGRLALDAFPGLLRETTRRFGEALREPDAAVRPAPDRWSVLEYACHVRDVHRVFGARLESMLAEDEPTFPDWDQDATAVADRYGEQDPGTVDVELLEAAADVAGHYATVTPEQLQRPGLRSNGSRFTVLTLGRYHLHDVLHHLHDIGRAEPRPDVAEGTDAR